MLRYLVHGQYQLRTNTNIYLCNLHEYIVSSAQPKTRVFTRPASYKLLHTELQ